jgi:hypothetical protein
LAFTIPLYKVIWNTVEAKVGLDDGWMCEDEGGKVRMAVDGSV